MSWFRNIFYSEDYGKKAQYQVPANSVIKDGAEHLVYISERLIIPNFRNQVIGIKPSRNFRTDEQKR